MSLGLSIGLGLGNTDESGGAGAPALPTSVTLDFSALDNEDPWTGAAGWTFDEQNGAEADITSGRWRGNLASGRQSIHADADTLDLNGIADVYVEAVAAAVDTSFNANIKGAIALFANYTPGVWNANNDSAGTTCYRASWSMNAVTIYRIVAGVATALGAAITISTIFGDGGSAAATLRLRAVVGASDVTLSLYRAGSLIDSRVDNDASRITNFRTVGGSVGDNSGISSMAALSGGAT